MGIRTKCLFLLLQLLCISSCSNSSRDEKIIQNNIRYILSNRFKSIAYIDCLEIHQEDIHDGICEVSYDINTKLAQHVYFIRNKQVATDYHNDYDDSIYRLSLRFGDYESIGLFPHYYKITINNFPTDVNSYQRLETMFRKYDPFSYIWVPGYNAVFQTYPKIYANAEFFINFQDGSQEKYTLKFRSFTIAYNDEPCGEKKYE